MSGRSNVSLRGIEVAYGPVRVLDRLDLEVAQSEFLVLLGPSGCGKSTLLNAIAGLTEIDDGEIWIGDRNVTWQEPKDRGIAMVFQSYALYPRMNVRAICPSASRWRECRARRSTGVCEWRPKCCRSPNCWIAARRTFGRPAPARRDRPCSGA